MRVRLASLKHFVHGDGDNSADICATGRYKIVPIEESPVVAYLRGDKKEYLSGSMAFNPRPETLEHFMSIGFHPAHQECDIRVVDDPEFGLVVTDGMHRSAVLYFLGFEEADVKLAPDTNFWRWRMPHKEQFQAVVRALNAKGVEYVFVRGWQKLPDLPDTDVDCVIAQGCYDDFMNVVKKLMDETPAEDFGEGEYCRMLYQSFFTRGPKDDSIPNGCFQMDTYSAFFYPTPLHDFRTKYTVKMPFNDMVFKDKTQTAHGFYVPRPEDEITLLVLRDLLDMGGAWKDKHKNRIRELLPAINHARLIDSLGGVLPGPERIVSHMKMNDFDPIFKGVMNGWA